jgi:hypothetical protein
MKNLHAKSLVLALVLVFGSAVVPAHADDFASSNLGSNRVTWDIAGSYDRAVLTVSRPDGTVFRKEFKSTVVPAFELTDRKGNVAADGAYNWQIVLSPRLDARQKDALAAARRANDPAAEARILAANGLDKPRIQSGSFAVAGGSTVPADPGELTANDQVIPDDLIVQGSACVGLDCVNNENFGFDTIRLKENNLRIHFDDTSNQAGFPANDWRLIANDSASGGSSKFSIEDSTSSKTPFTITAGAATNSIFADSTGRIGLRTSTPVLDLHINTSNTPAIRLEQNNSGGFTAQTWDIGANEANFFVRDVTGGSRLSLRIRPGAPTSSVDISSDGDVGIGTGSPDNSLHVLRSDGTAKILVEETSGTTAFRELLKLANNGEPFLIFNNTNTNNNWSNGLNGGQFQILDQADVQTEFTLTAAGNLTVSGTLTPNSSREVKQEFDDIDRDTVLGRVLALPITTWAYKADPNVRHMGPMAEDFYSAFNLGPDDKGISVTDSAGVAFAAIQGLYHEVEQKNAALTARNAELEDRLATLEKLVQELAAKQN